MEKKILSPEEFNALPINERKVLIAQDVINQIKAAMYKASRGNYLSLRVTDEDIQHEASARECLLENKVKCTVCARGALFASSVRYKNKLNLSNFGAFNFYYPEDIDTPKEQAQNATSFMEEFSIMEQGIIEGIFENADRYAKSALGMSRDDEHTEESSDLWNRMEAYRKNLMNVWDFREDISSDDFILLSICQNIVDNKGELVI